MNTKLLQTRLSSLKHYQSEIDKLQEAIGLTRSTRNDIVKSMIEFCDLLTGDLFIYGGTFYKFLSVENSYENNNKSIEFKINVETQVTRYNGIEWVKNEIYLPIEKVILLKAIGNLNDEILKTT